MRQIFIAALIIILTASSFATDIDTVDVWTVKINGKAVINSNAVAIIHGGPMQLNLAPYADNDVVEICYWTDNGAEKTKWNFTFKDADHNFLASFTNPIDSSLGNKKVKKRKKDIEYLELHKNYISYKVEYLKQLLKEKNIKKIFVEFDKYGRNVCVISVD